MTRSVIPDKVYDDAYNMIQTRGDVVDGNNEFKGKCSYQTKSRVFI